MVKFHSSPFLSLTLEEEGKSVFPVVSCASCGPVPQKGCVQLKEKGQEFPEHLCGHGLWGGGWSRGYLSPNMLKGNI